PFSPADAKSLAWPALRGIFDTAYFRRSTNLLSRTQPKCLPRRPSQLGWNSRAVEQPRTDRRRRQFRRELREQNIILQMDMLHQIVSQLLDASGERPPTAACVRRQRAVAIEPLNFTQAFAMIVVFK